MTTATTEIYRTESGAIYEVLGNRIRRHASDRPGLVEDWEEYRSISRLPASLLRAGEAGEVLEVVLANGRRVFTSRLVVPFGPDAERIW